MLIRMAMFKMLLLYKIIFCEANSNQRFYTTGFTLSGWHPSQPSLKGRSTAQSFTFKPHCLAGSVCLLSGLSYFPLIYPSYLPLCFTPPRNQRFRPSHTEVNLSGRVGCTPGVCKTPSLMREGWGGCRLILKAEFCKDCNKKSIF